ncbi:MAG: cation diffusion facilitator family transporter, partial [Planctomycetota bacterium]
ERRIALEHDCSAVGMDAWHHRSDAVTSAAAAMGIGVALIGGPAYASADEWAALAACAIIVINALHFASQAVGELMDVRPETEVAGAVERAALEVSGARAVEKVMIRKMGPVLYADLHLEVDPSLTVIEAHEIAHLVKDRIRRRVPRVADVLVHVEPHAAPPDD